MLLEPSKVSTFECYLQLIFECLYNGSTHVGNLNSPYSLHE